MSSRVEPRAVGLGTVDEAFRGPKGGPEWNIAGWVAIRALGLKVISSSCSNFRSARAVRRRCRDCGFLINPNIVRIDVSRPLFETRPSAPAGKRAGRPFFGWLLVEPECQRRLAIEKRAIAQINRHRRKGGGNANTRWQQPLSSHPNLLVRGIIGLQAGSGD
jgi:hypothetical protein